MEDAWIPDEEPPVAVAPRKLTVSDLDTLRGVARRYDENKQWNRAFSAWQIVTQVMRKETSEKMNDSTLCVCCLFVCLFVFFFLSFSSFSLISFLQGEELLNMEDTQEHADSLFNMGRALFETNSVLERPDVYERVAQLFLRNLKLQSNFGHKGTAQFANALSWAALAVDKAGRHAQAVVLGEDLVETREKLGQKGSQEWIIAVNNLGFALNKAGQSKRAVEMLLLCEQACSTECKKHVALVFSNLLFLFCSFW